MRLDVAHELGLALAAMLAFLIVLAGGELSPVAWALLFAPWVSFALRLKDRAAPGLSGTLLALASLGLGLATLAQRGMEAAVLGGGYALAGMLAARLLTRTSYAHDLQALVVTLLLVMAGSVLNVGLSYGPVFLLYGISVVWALTTRQLLASAARSLEGRDPGHLVVLKGRRDVVTPAFLGVTAGVAVAVLVATGVVFVSFPRIGFGGLSSLSKQNGRFPNAVSLRGAPRAAVGGNEVVARVRGVGRAAFERGLYLRGAVYDAVDEHGFAQLEPPPRVRPSQLALARAPEEGVYDVTLSPIAGRLLFTLGPTRNAFALGGGRANPSYRLGVVGANARTELEAAASLESSLRYRVRGGIAAPGYIPESRGEPLVLDVERAEALLRVPGDLDPRVRKLADEVVAGATSPVEKAERLRRFLLEEFSYTLEQPNGTAEVPLRAFLLEERRGHCEYFASAYALLLRSQGIAARVVGGYQGGAWDDSEDVVVFQGKNAHAWVEWFLEGAGWIVDDPTPLATAPREQLDGLAGLLERLRRFWDDRVLDYSLQDQRSMLRDLGRNLSSGSSEGAARYVLAGLGLVVLLGAFAALLRRRGGSARKAPGHRVGEALQGALERCQDAPLAPERTLREAVLTLDEGRVTDEERRLLAEALAAYEADRFGGVSLPEARVEGLLAALARVPSSVRGRRDAG